MKKFVAWFVAAAAAVGSAGGAVVYTNAGPITANETGAGSNLAGMTVSRDGSASDTLYFRFTVDQPQSNIGNENYYAAFQLFEGGAERLGVGNGWDPWAYSAFNTAGGNADLNSPSPEAGQTYQLVRATDVIAFVVRVKFNASADDTVTVWMSPDFGLPETSQTANRVTTFSANCTFNEIHLREGGGGAGWTFTNILIGSLGTDVGFAAPPLPSFQDQTPADGAVSINPAAEVSITAVAGGQPLDTNSVKLYVDGALVTPGLTVSGSTVRIAYQPPSPLAAGTSHTARAEISDTLGASVTSEWAFTTWFPALPLAHPGVFTNVSGGGVGRLLFSSSEPWMGTNYGAAADHVLYVRTTMRFNDLNGETGTGGGYGGLHLYQGVTEKLLLGNSWLTLSWSIAPIPGYPDSGLDLAPATAVVLGEWHTLVEKIQFRPGTTDVVTAWLDPNFSQPETVQAGAVTGELDTAFDAIRLRAGNGTASADFSNIVLATSTTDIGFAPPLESSIQSLVPAPGAAHVSPATPVSAEIVEGSLPVDTNTLALSVDGSAVAASLAVSSNLISVSHQPAAPFAAGSVHTGALQFADIGANTYATSWVFAVGYPTLPAALPGPYPVASGAGAGLTVLNAADGWIDGGWNVNTDRTLWLRFTMRFNDLNGETGAGGGFGGLHFYDGAAERLLLGNTWLSTNWSLLVAGGPGDGGLDFHPVTPIVLGEWHTVAAKIQYVSGTDDVVTVWLDPDFALPPCDGTNVSAVYRAPAEFDSIHLRAGNGTASADFTNLVFGLSAADLGFPSEPPQAGLALRRTSSNVLVRWDSCAGVLEEAPLPGGPWTISAVLTNPAPHDASTYGEHFFRVRQ